MAQALVTVVVDTYNHEKYIEQAIVSVIEQDFPASEYEIVVVDDGSTDRTPEIVRKFSPRVRLLRKKNGGQASAFNAAFSEVRGEAVAFLDGDDWWVAGKLEAVMSVLDRNREIAGVGHGYYEYYDGTGQTKIRAAEVSRMLSLRTVEQARDCRLALPFLHMGAFTIRKTVLGRCMPIPERLIFDADAAVGMAAMAAGAMVLNAPLFYYRQHDNNLVGARDCEDENRTRRKYEMGEAMYEVVYALLGRLGIAEDSIIEFIGEDWLSLSREIARRFGRNRIRTFRTEMRHFRFRKRNPGLSDLLFNYVVVGGASLLVPTHRFYELRKWYAQRRQFSSAPARAKGTRNSD